MSTDEIRDAFHSVFERVVDGVTTDPGLVDVVRRRHARQQRLLALGAPLGVAAVTASAIVGAMAINTGNGSGVIASTPSAGSTRTQPSRPTQSQQPETLQTVSLVGHDLALPSSWTLSGNRKLIDLDTMHPAQLVGGKDQSVTATSADGRQQFEATVYTGPIADAERLGNSADGDPTFTHVTINGREASIKVTGPPTTCLTVSRAKHGPNQRHPVTRHGPGRSKQPGFGVVEGACPATESADAPYGEARYTFGNGDFMLIDTNGMDSEVLTDFLTTALSN